MSYYILKYNCFSSKILCFVYSDRDDLATLVATLDAEINPNTDNTQDPKIEGSIKEDEKEDIVKEEETDSSKYLEQSMYSIDIFF